MRPIDAYCAAFEQLRAETLDDLVALVADEVVFRDPFNDIAGRGPYRAVFEDMLARVRHPRFTVTDRLGAGSKWMLRWRFTGNAPGLGALDVEGTSFVTLDGAGLVVSHIDYWDASPLFEKIPVLGGILSRLRRRLSAS
jgi:hypothetical protein